MKIKFILVVLLSIITMISFSQAVSFIDPGQAFLKLHLEINDQVYTRVNNYKVAGTQYLFGKQVTGDVFTTNEIGKEVLLSYNTYNQTLEIPANNGSGFLVKSALEVDSFYFTKNDKSFFKENFSFISSNRFGEKKPVFLLEVSNGFKFSLYKAYHSDLGIVSTNYIQSDLRQFDLKYEYYYVDFSSTDKKLNKLKITKSSLRNNFKLLPKAILVIDSNDFDGNNEIALKNLFEVLNN